MSKRTIFIIVAVVLSIVILAGAYFYWINKKSSVTDPFGEDGNVAEDITNNATKGVMPGIQTNPLEDKPDVNPADKANPFKDIKTNPF